MAAQFNTSAQKQIRATNHSGAGIERNEGGIRIPRIVEIREHGISQRLGRGRGWDRIAAGPSSAIHLARERPPSVSKRSLQAARVFDFCVRREAELFTLDYLEPLTGPKLANFENPFGAIALTNPPSFLRSFVGAGVKGAPGPSFDIGAGEAIGSAEDSTG